MVVMQHREPVRPLRLLALELRPPARLIDKVMTRAQIDSLRGTSNRLCA